MWAFLTLLLCILILRIEKSDGASEFEMFFDNATCTSDDPNIFEKLSCYLSKSVKRRTFSIEMQYKKDIRHFLLNILVVLPRKQNPDFVLLNLTAVDGCRVLANKNQAPLIKLGISILDRYGNIPHKCPFLKDKLYFMRGFRLDMGMLPAFVFETEMITWFDFILDRKKIIKGYLRSVVTMKKNKNSKN